MKCCSEKRKMGVEDKEKKMKEERTESKGSGWERI